MRKIKNKRIRTLIILLIVVVVVGGLLVAALLGPTFSSNWQGISSTAAAVVMRGSSLAYAGAWGAPSN